MYRTIGSMVDLGGRMSYEAFATSDTSQEARILAWTTPEQRDFNASRHTRCVACRGVGYHVYRSKGELVREALGCQDCEGLGVITGEEQP